MLTPLTPYKKLNFAYNQPVGSAVLRQQLSDFFVNEHLGFTLTGEGEHVWLQIEKQEYNTQFLAKQLAACASVKNMDVGYAGLKDRRAITGYHSCITRIILSRS